MIANLPRAAFIAIDEEMTGISLPGAPRPPKDDTPAQRYQSLKKVPERYSIVQFGVALFIKNEDEDGGFTVKKYNFYIFPSGKNNSREVTLNPSSIAFLKEHDMDFNLWTKEGIPFSTSDQAADHLAKYTKKAQSLLEELPAQKPMDPGARKVELTRPEDVNFHARAMASLREWIDSARSATEEGTSFLLPPANAFLRRALYESIGKEYPSLTLEKYGSNQIRVLRMTPEEKEIRRQRQRKEAWEWFMVEELGFWRVFYALSQANRGFCPINSLALASTMEEVGLQETLELKPTRKIPMVVHNGLMDLLFLMTHCHSPTLPESYEECKSLVTGYFPLIYDTKVMATEGAVRQDNTVLSQLFTTVVPDETAADLHLTEDATGAAAHEASHDAYMTGAVFYGLSLAAAPEDNIYPWTLGDYETICRDRFVQNKLYLMVTMYTIDLEDPNEDPLSRGMHVDAAFRVSGSDPSVATRDIVRCLTSLTSPFPNTRLHFEIVWIDDTTFLVAARDEGNLERLLRHGSMIEAALRERFTASAVVGMRHHLQQKEEEVESKKRKATPWSLWKWLGFAKNEEEEEEEERPNKRRRVS